MLKLKLILMAITFLSKMVNYMEFKIGDWVRSEIFNSISPIGQIIEFSIDPWHGSPIAVCFRNLGIIINCKADELIKISDEEAMIYLLEN